MTADAGGTAEQSSGPLLQIIQLREAIRLTREYLGDRALPAVEGWEWFDAIKATGGFDGFGRCGCALDPQRHGRPRAGDLFYCRKPAGHEGDHGQDAQLGRQP